MKNVLIIIFLFLVVSGFGQTTPLTFNSITTTPDLISPDRGAEHWKSLNQFDDVNYPRVPAGYDSALNFYYRFSWLDIESSTLQGTYNWSVFDSKIDQAIDSNRAFSFGVMPMCTTCGLGAVSYPAYLHTLMQAEATNSQDWLNAQGFWVPNWNSPNFQARWKALLTAIAAHISSTTYHGRNLADVIFYIDVRGYGDQGSWSNAPYAAATPTGRVATVASLDSIISTAKTAFANYPLVINSNAFDNGNQALVPTAVSYYALTTTNAWGQLGWRRDDWGDSTSDAILSANPYSYNPGSGNVNFNTLITGKYQYAPVVGEPTNSATNISLGCGTPYCDLRGQVLKYHATSFGNGNYAVAATNTNLQAAVIAASNVSGYRLALTGGTMTTNLVSNTNFSIVTNWQNTGVAPPYVNWNVVYELRASDCSVVWTGTSTFKPKLFLPSGSSNTIIDNFNLGTVPSGVYTLYVIVRDPTGFRFPMPLAITGSCQDGGYVVRTGVGVGSATPPFVINAGTDQSLASGTTTTTLTGTVPVDSTGLTITWTKISGPNNPTIVSPVVATTNITGMINGRYQFQFAVVDRAGLLELDTVAVNVGGSTPIGPTAVITGPPGISLPTSSTTFSGTSSTDDNGTVNQYLWLTVSGPGSPTITTPTASSTTITGLVVGTYIFQLQVTDNNGNINSVTKQLIVNPVPPVGATIFTTQTPVSGTGNDGSGGMTLGVKFQSSLDGLITGVRFYKTTGNNGTHVGALYNASGTLLAQATFTGETGAGWQNVTFSTPIQITKNTTYVASYYSPSGTYVTTSNYFTAAVVNTPLTALANSTSVNGVYVYNSTGITFPNATYQSSNYWVDVFFTANQFPVAVISAPSSITLPTSSVTLDGTGSYDPDGTALSAYAWSLVSGPNTPVIVNPALSTTSVTGMVAGTYIFQLTVTDNTGVATNSTTKTIVVNPAGNIPPTAVITGTFAITLPVTTAALSGTSSTDPDGTIAGYAWSLLSGPGGSSFSATNTSTTILTVVTAGTYNVQLIVTDNLGATGTTTQNVVVSPVVVVSPSLKYKRGGKVKFN